jgi:enolase
MAPISAVDAAMLAVDGTPNKSKLGANAILAVSMAVARAAASAHGMPLYRYLGGANACILPVPCMNVLNGGKHADNTVDFQEFMIAPHNAPTFAEAIRKGMETFHTLKQVLRGKSYSTAVARRGYLYLSAAASEMWDDGKYVLFKSTKKAITSQELIKLWESWAKQYPIVLLEDGMGENDWDGWRDLTSSLGSRIELVGDDVFCTNPRILQDGIDKGIANAVLIKLNQIGSVTETLDTIELARHSNYRCFVSHRSGETEDTFIADLTVATGSGHIKTGSGCRSERVAKFNQFLRIEERLGSQAKFAGRSAFGR